MQFSGVNDNVQCGDVDDNVQNDEGDVNMQNADGEENVQNDSGVEQGTSDGDQNVQSVGGGDKEKGASGESRKRHAVNYLSREVLCQLEDDSNNKASFSDDYDFGKDGPYKYPLGDSFNEDNDAIFNRYVDLIPEEMVSKGDIGRKCSILKVNPM